MNVSKDVPELEKGSPHLIIELIEYLPKAVVSRTLVKKITGNICALSFDAGEQMEEKISPFDNYIQIIDGTAVIHINKIKHRLITGQGIIIPAHTRHNFTAHQQFKMLSTVIKSGYDD